MNPDRLESWDENEPLIEGLEALPAGAFHRPRASDELRRSVGERTARAVRSRVRRRRLLVLALVVIAYGGGLATALCLADTVGGPGPEWIVASRGGPDDAPAPIERVVDPGELEKQAAGASPEERIRLLRRAGDLYLSGLCDVERALGCYGRVLDAMSPLRRTAVEPGDSWLLLAMKEARR